MKITNIFKDFLNNEKTSAILLILVTIISLILSNSFLKVPYSQLINSNFLGISTKDIVNDGLMTFFFLLIGLELEIEFYIGELSNLKDAIFPVVAAIGGMIVPCCIYFILNNKTPYQQGVAIPMATDIAFGLGVLSLIGKKIPFPIKIFLTALAVIDDLGAILIIAIFYTKMLVISNLIISIVILLLLFILNRLKINKLTPYLIGGFFMWFFMLKSGVHATISGVLLAFVIPFGNGDSQTISYKLQKFISKPVAFIILPIFALINTNIEINGNVKEIFNTSYGLGIFLGLLIGKPLGVVGLLYILIKINILKLPKGLNFKSILGVGFIAGIGFTMSIFITNLAFNNHTTIDNAKLIILISSFLAAIIGFIYFKSKV
ncbi:MAG: Na+/H+ antiporter NhaA [Solirubrobacteraceae bacterium]